ncbi:MAG: RsmD family RNA methyltransferase [Chloroflexota bacterium]|nr:RsmD family RNA methyltransferase [Chloroflexota bacterium]
MRVIAGEAKGFKLKGPAGPGTRPMADKIKGALFSMLASLGVAPERVLDLYAGTGSIGIEALSRGAGWADFVEQNAAAAAVVRANLAHTKFAPAARVHQQPVLAFLRQAERVALPPYDLVVLDPPYADPEIVPTLERIGASPLVQSATVVAIGHSPRVALPERAGRLARLRERCHGDSCFSLYEVDDAEADAGAPPPDVP